MAQSRLGTTVVDDQSQVGMDKMHTKAVALIQSPRSNIVVALRAWIRMARRRGQRMVKRIVGINTQWARLSSL